MWLCCGCGCGLLWVVVGCCGVAGWGRGWPQFIWLASVPPSYSLLRLATDNATALKFHSSVAFGGVCDGLLTQKKALVHVLFLFSMICDVLNRLLPLMKYQVPVMYIWLIRIVMVTVSVWLEMVEMLAVVSESVTGCDWL